MRQILPTGLSPGHSPNYVVSRAQNGDAHISGKGEHCFHLEKSFTARESQSDSDPGMTLEAGYVRGRLLTFMLRETSAKKGLP